jgi:hypothetical protein
VVRTLNGHKSRVVEMSSYISFEPSGERRLWVVRRVCGLRCACGEVTGEGGQEKGSKGGKADPFDFLKRINKGPTTSFDVRAAEHPVERRGRRGERHARERGGE